MKRKAKAKARTTRDVASFGDAVPVEAAHEPDQLDLTPGEVAYERWGDLCAQLFATGAVDEEDLGASICDDSTPGRRLFIAIRAWGQARAEMAVERTKRGSP